jgi:hypothetical protein
LLTDSCSSANFNTYWTNGGDWSYNSSAQNYKGHHSSGNPDTARYLTAKNIIDLDNLGTGTVNISFDTPILASATPVSVAPLNPDTCVTFNNWTQGSAWSLNSGNFKAAGANKPTADRDLILKNPLDLSSYGSTGTIDIILDTPVISPIESNAFSESCNNLNSWTNTGAWSISSNTFRGNCINNSNNDGTLTLTSPLSLVQYGSTADIVVSWKQFTDGNLGSSQGLNFAYTLDGTNWTNTQI